MDNPDGYDNYKCKEYPGYCTLLGDWYDKFRSACPVTCKKGKDISIPKNCWPISYELQKVPK